MTGALAGALALAAALAGCGGSSAARDAGSVGDDDGGGPPDGAGMPPPPALGAQIDRMGRPGIADFLVAVFPASGPDPASQKDAYNRASDPTLWRTTTLRTNVVVEDELKANIAAFDAIDTSQVQNMLTLPGCGNTLGYSPPVNLLAYRGIADLLADDELYVDTSRATCTVYLALELEYANGGSPVHMACGGRIPAYDALDVLYEVLASGADGLDQANNFAPRLHSTATAHADTKDTFPFLGPPNP
ncbi:MAG TPA: hypothetical protein VH165_26290 [Kofleriaceae bacterium]|nr:hypothetical protein [Kofleriaceae bacterium]